VDRDPKVLWLVGRCSSSSTLHVKHAFGVSPSVRPDMPWEVVWESEICFPVSVSLSDSVEMTVNSPLSELLLKCLRPILPHHRLPTRFGGPQPASEALEWVGLVSCRSQQPSLALQESRWFVTDRDFFGDLVEYSRDVLNHQRGQVSAEEMRTMMREVQGVVEDVVLVLSSHVA
jgi:hypothetical protein